MNVRSLFRPAAQALSGTTRKPQSPSCAAAALTPLTTLRGHKTTARTKRSLKIAPHDSFLPDRSAAFPAADSIIYNPPASEPSPANTPFIFLPRNDPRRSAVLRMRRDPDAPLGMIPRELSGGRGSAGQSEDGEGAGDGHLPPAMRYKKREPRYHLQREHIDEMRRLRSEDPIRWSVGHLAQKFDCSPIFVQMAAPASAEHLAWLKAKMERKMERWGPIRKQAREDRKRRAEMLYRGEL